MKPLTSILSQISTYILLMFTFSCSDPIDQLTKTIIGQEYSVVSVEEAKSYFEREIEPIGSNLSDGSARAGNIKKRKPVRVPLWHLAKEQKKKGNKYNLLSIPLAQDKQDLGLYGNRKLLVYKDEYNNNKLTYSIVEAFADVSYLKENNYEFNDDNFTGTLLFYDWEENFEMGCKMKNGQPISVVESLKVYDEDGSIVEKKYKTSSGARQPNSSPCIVNVYEKCYGTKYIDNGETHYVVEACFADRTERIGDCDGQYWPIWKNFVDFTSNGQPGDNTISKPAYLSNKLTVSFYTRDCVHAIIDKIMNSANPLSRLGSILSASGQSYDFYRFVSDLTSPQTEFKVYVTEGQLSGINPPNASTQFYTGSKRVVITINSDYLNTATDLSVARTISHELLHAYLFIGQSSPDTYGYGFGTVQNYLTSRSGADAHHVLMANEYLTTISSSLGNFASVTNTTLPAGPPYESSVEEYIASMAWAGLDAANSVKWNSLSESQKNAIRTIIDNEKTGTGNRSNKKGCN